MPILEQFYKYNNWSGGYLFYNLHIIITLHSFQFNKVNTFFKNKRNVLLMVTELTEKPIFHTFFFTCMKTMHHRHSKIYRA